MVNSTEQATESESAGLLDLTRVRLRELWSLDESTILDQSLARAVGSAGTRPQEAVSAFNSAI
jgi:FXSXX-COOH protein